MTEVVRLIVEPSEVVHVTATTDPVITVVGVTAAGPRGATGPQGPPGPTIPPYATTIGDGVETVFTITHNLATKDVIPHIYNLVAPFAAPLFTPLHTTINTITLEFAIPPALNAMRVVVTSGGTGPGVPLGGAVDEVLAKASATDFDTIWASISALLPELKGFVIHGADPTVPRPTGYASVEWYGSVLPDNIDQAVDTWIDSS